MPLLVPSPCGLPEGDEADDGLEVGRAEGEGLDGLNSGDVRVGQRLPAALLAGFEHRLECGEADAQAVVVARISEERRLSTPAQRIRNLAEVVERMEARRGRRHRDKSAAAHAVIRATAVVARNVVLADWLFTTPAIVVQPVTGVWMATQAGFPLTTGWLAIAIALKVFVGACWLPVV